MPEYFFHVSLELLSQHRSQSPNPPVSPVDLSRAFKSLRPFLRSTRPRTTRDTAYSTISRKSTQSAQPDVAEQIIPAASDDHRIDRITIECADMVEDSPEQDEGHKNDIISTGIGTAICGVQTRGKFETINVGDSKEEWGIVHLYRDIHETPGLYKTVPNAGLDSWDGGSSVPRSKTLPVHPPPRDEDCTTLCMLAVPSYITPADFLNFVGDDTKQQVSHFRMIKTSRQNRYMVLMKFKHGKQARNWQHEWNGKVFNSHEPEACHVVFLKSVEIMQTSANYSDGASEVPLSNSVDGLDVVDRYSLFKPTTKPPPPRTSSLLELPTCTVCLERMDETTGLLTILCQHVFHCTCFEKWSAGGCPVCRFTHDDFTKQRTSKNKSDFQDLDPSNDELACETCHIESNTWQCLICGHIGCGRYQSKHAFKHYEETGHSFSMDLTNRAVWDYTGDVYVHRIIENASSADEKLIELPGRRQPGVAPALEGDDEIDAVKRDNMALEYAQLLSHQLESQRIYFDEMIQRTVDKATEATKIAQRATEDCSVMRDQILQLQQERSDLLTRLPKLERENERLETRSKKLEQTARDITSKYSEERIVSASLMEKLTHLERSAITRLTQRIQELEEGSATKDLLLEGMQDELRDAHMEVAAQRKLRELVEIGELTTEELAGASLETGPAAKTALQRRRGKKNQVNTPVGFANVASSAPATATEVEDPSSRLQSQLGFDFSNLRPGENYNPDRAKALYEEFSARMAAEGLVVSGSAAESTSDVNRHSASVEDDVGEDDNNKDDGDDTTNTLVDSNGENSTANNNNNIDSKKKRKNKGKGKKRK